MFKMCVKCLWFEILIIVLWLIFGFFIFTNVKDSIVSLLYGIALVRFIFQLVKEYKYVSQLLHAAKHNPGGPIKIWVDETQNLLRSNGTM